ncbi:MAG: iron-containing alcohol dehydrogenase [Caldilineaceae bacterium]
MLPGHGRQRRVGQARDPRPWRRRYDEAACILTGAPEARAVDGVAWVETLCADLAIPGLGAYGLTTAEIPAAVAKGKAASSMKGNPIALTDGELAAILTQAL